MWKYILIISVIFAFWSCDNRSTDPETDIWSRVKVFYADTLFYEEVLDASDNATNVTRLLPDNSQFTLEKYYFEIETDRADDFTVSYRCIAKRSGYYSNYYSCGRQDTININASGGFATVEPGKVCGAILDIYWGPLAMQDFYVLQDSVVVDTFSTNTNGFYDLDINLGIYQLTFANLYPDGEMYNFYLDDFYKDVYIDLEFDK